MENQFELDQEIQSLMVPPTSEERDVLEKLILDGKHVDPLVVAVVDTKSILADGYTRLSICQAHGIPFTTRQKAYSSREEMIQWVINNQMGRRNLTEERKAYFRGKEYLNDKKQVGAPKKNKDATVAQLSEKTATSVAEKYGVSERTVHNDAAFAEAVEELPPEQKEAVLNGKSVVPKKDISTGKKPFCPACARKLRVGQELPKSCPDCKALRKKPKKTLSERIDEELAQPEEDVQELTVEEQMNAKNSEIESFCTDLMKYVEENMPEDAWLDYMGLGDGAIQTLKDGCSAVRSAKCTEVCPMCEGEKCRECQGTGRVPTHVNQQLVG